MQERDIFLSALEINDPQKRAEHLQEACAGDTELQARVESLLASHEGPSQFLNTPAVEQIVEDPESPKLSPTMMLNDDSTNNDSVDDDSDFSEEVSLAFLSPSEHPGSLGRLGHYDILEVIGQGAFGTVMRAFDEKLQRVVAIKVLAPEMAAASPARKRFLREARASAAVRHENVVAIYSVEDHPIPYLVMEYIPGKTLQKRLDEQGPLDISHVVRLGKQIADGLAAAHAVDLIHRDVKPGNILLEGGLDERVKITDFGLARTADDASLTRSGIIAGTPLYMAPEQALGQRLDQRADLFSLGSVLYQMISGRPPFRAPNTIGVLKRVAEDAPRPIQEIIPEAPSWLCELIGYLHEKDPDRRYSSARQVSEILDHCLIDMTEGRTPKIPSPRMADGKRAPGAETIRSESKRKPTGPNTLTKIAAAAVLLFLAAALMEATGVTHVFSKAEPVVLKTDSATTPTSTSGTVPISDLAPAEVTIPQLPPIEWPADAPPLAIAPFDTDQAEQHQKAWAEYLGLPEERNILLGQAKDGKDVRISLVLIPPGEFMMGSSPEEVEKLLGEYRAAGLRQADFTWINAEGPQRRVRITRPFYMSRTEITNAQFRCFAEGANYKTDAESSGQGSWTMKQGRMVLDPNTTWHSTGFPLADTAPVIHVSWNDADACCQWLTEQESDLTFALPTEAQWEYACRAGTTTAWFFGDDESLLNEYAIANLTWMRWVGIKKPNAFGLYDMHGNVWEWCRDSFSNYRDAATVDPVGPENHKRMVRGGNFYTGNQQEWYNGNGRRSAARLEAGRDHRILDKGFRVTAMISEEVLQAKLSSPEKKAAPARVVEIQWPENAPPLVTSPLKEDEAKRLQQEWADYLGLPVEKEIPLGRNRLGADVTLSLVLIPPGEFLMGSTDEQIEKQRELAIANGLSERDLPRINMEGPQRTVRITRPFYLSKCELATDQFRSFVQATEYVSEPEASGKGSWTPGPNGQAVLDPEKNWKQAAKKHPQGPDGPVVNVTWNDAQACCEWLSTKAAELKFGLPTEAQWEHACRAGTNTTWSFGEDVELLSQYAVVKEKWAQDIGQRLPNAFGLHDMHGNVWEWCQDGFYDYRDAESVDPLGSNFGERRMIRGGCFLDGVWGDRWLENNGCRSAVRFDRSQGNPFLSIGFRPAAAISKDVIQAAVASQAGK